MSRMRPRLGLLLICGLLVPSELAAWGLDVHRFIVDRAIRDLPDRMRPFYDEHRSFIVEHSIDPDLWRQVGMPGEGPRHYLNLDAYGEFPFPRLPRDRDAAVCRFGADVVDRNGTLPWRVAELFARLVDGFERHARGGSAGALDDVRLFSSVVSHYVSDACVPFHAVVSYDGQATAQRGIHRRFETELFTRYRSRVSVAPQALLAVDDPRDFAFALLGSFEAVDAPLRADRDAARVDPRYGDRYFDRFFADARPVLEQRLAASISRVASVLAAAWERAGRPGLPGGR